MKVKLIKLEGGRVGCVRAPWQGKFCVSGLAQAPSVPLNISPSVVLRTPLRPAALSAATGGRGGSAAFKFYQLDFYVTHRFFVSFLARPALLPFGKRGFRAAIYKIARPQPPAAAL